MANKFFQKVTVQAALINAIPTLLTAIVAIVSIYLTYRLSDKSFQQTARNFDKQYQRDSLNSVHQDSVATLQTLLNKSQMQLASEQFRNDSIYQSKEFAIQKNQLEILKLQQKENDTSNQSGFSISEVQLRNYPLKLDYSKKDFDLKEIADYYGYEPELIYEQNPGTVSSYPTIGQYLTVYNKKNQDLIPNMPLLFTKNEIMRYLAYRNLAGGLNDSLEILKIFLVDIEIENNSKLPITILSTSYVDVKCNPQNPRQIGDTILNNKILNPSRKSNMTGIMLYPLCCHVPNNVEVEIEINYKTIYGKRSKRYLYRYDFAEGIFVAYD